MSPLRRVALCGAILTCGLAAQAGLENLTNIDRPPLRRPLSSIPLELGDWVGHDEPIRKDVEEQSQATEFLNRVYKSESHPGIRLSLWINYSHLGANLRHSPAICLPSNGYSLVESDCRVLGLDAPNGKPIRISRIGYAKGELALGIGFWYYIFGEGELEHYVRNLPITSRSSHGRTTRGSSLTVEVFDDGASGTDDETLKEFIRSLLAALEPILPKDRAEYFVP